MTWDNAFGEWRRAPFAVPDKVPWSQVGAVLSTKWEAACGSPLTHDNLYYLACKAFRYGSEKMSDACRITYWNL